jgi:hypothetical protein
MAKSTLETFKKLLGYGGKKPDEEKALAVLTEIGVNASNDLGETPLIIASYLGRADVLKKIIAQVADVDHYIPGSLSDSAMMEACGHRRLECMELLIDAGADLEQADRFGMTPLAKIFTNTFSDPVPSALYLVSKGAKITDKVIEMGLAWNRPKFLELLKTLEVGLETLSIPEAENELKKEERKTDTALDIVHLHHTVNNGDYFETAKVMWHKLVPKSGQAATVQGELLRAIEKLRDEAQRNGNVNFHKNCHGILITYLRQHLADERIFTKQTVIQINSDLDRLSMKNSPYTEDDLYDRISDRIVDWYLKNPEQIPHHKNEVLYC